jgi:hypothetical protein
MEPRIDHGRLVGSEPGSSSARIRSMRLTGAFITLCALVFVSGIAGCWPTR